MGEDGSGKQDQTPIWRNPTWITAITGLVAAVAGLAALWIGTSGDDSETATGPGDGPTTEQSTSTTATTTSVDGYWSTDGSEPTRSQDCYGVVGACLDDPVEAVSEALGTPDTRYPIEGAGQLVTLWGLGPGGVGLTTDEVDVIVEASVQGGGDFRAALPEGWTLGEFSLRDVIDSEGAPSDVYVFGGDGTTIVTIAYCKGPESSYTEEYSLNVGWEDEIAMSLNEENAIELVGDRAATGYSVRSRGVEGVTETC